jgi:phospholipase B1
MKFISKLVIAAAALLCAQPTLSLSVNNINDCPALPPRSGGPANVTDLRFDDIRVFMALGDSITAGFSLKEQSALSLQQVYEFRGASYPIGGDSGSVTVPNLFRRFRKDQHGMSKGKRMSNICYGELCVQVHVPNVDVLNAAQSGAMATNLVDEVDYLVRQLRAMPEIDYNNDWKFLNIQIGSNDMCLACSSILGDGSGPLSADKYEQHIRAALEAVRARIPRVYVNLLGNFKVSDVYAWGEKYTKCKILHRTPGFNLFCACALQSGSLGNALRAKMDQRMQEYNERLVRIYNDYRNLNDPDFGVGLQVYETDLTTFPAGSLSNFDCFHPSESLHAYLAKVTWNGLALPIEQRPTHISYDPNLKIRCPTANDRLRI